MTHPFHQYMKHLSYGGTELIFSSANDGKHLSFVTSSTSCHTLSTEAAHDSTQGDEVFPSPPSPSTKSSPPKALASSDTSSAIDVRCRAWNSSGQSVPFDLLLSPR